MDRQLIRIVFAVLFNCISIAAQETRINAVIEDFMLGNCNERIDFDILLEDVEQSVVLLSKYRSDTLKCNEQKIYETTCQLLHRSHDSALVSILIDYTTDTNNYYCGYLINCIYDRIHLIKLSENDLQKLNNPQLYKCDARGVPLLISYLKIESMIPTLYQWGETHQLNEYNKTILKVALARLGVEEEIEGQISRDINSDSEWLIYFDYLNFIRKRETTEKMISYLSDDSEIVLEEIPDTYSIYKCKLSALSLYHLSMYVKDFPYKISYFDLYEDVSDKVQAAREWFEENKDYQFSTELGSFKL